MEMKIVVLKSVAKQGLIWLCAKSYLLNFKPQPFSFFATAGSTFEYLGNKLHTIDFQK